MTFRSILRWGAYVSLLLTAIVMWYPGHDIAGLGLSNRVLHTSLFGITTFLFVVADSTRTPRISPFITAGSLNEIASVRWGWHLTRVALLCVLYAAVLEVGQFIAPTRKPGIIGFAENSAAVLVTTGVIYIAVRIFSSNRRLRRLALGEITRASDSFRVETKYSGMMRDTIQEAYAVSFAEQPAEERIAKMSSLLSDALGVEPPAHGEEFLNSTFGVRRAPDIHPLPTVRAADVAPAKSEMSQRDGSEPRLT